MAQYVRCWISPNYSIVEEQFSVTNHRLGQCPSYISVTCTVSDMASSIKRREGGPLPWQVPFPWIQENQITFFIPVSELLPGLGTCSTVSQAGLHWWQRGPGMPCRASLTILKSFASKSGWHHTSCADVKLALKQAARKINVSAPICKISLHMPWGSGPFGTQWNCHRFTDPQLDTWHQY